MDTSVPTVPRLKQAFILAQTNLLSQPLTPSQSWARSNDASNSGIPKRVLSDALFILNQAVQQHCRRVYPPQASYNVAEQISSLYNRDADARLAMLKDEERVVTGLDGDPSNPLLGLDLSTPDAIESLPDEWPDERDVEASTDDAARYAQSVARLRELNERRAELRRRVEKLRMMERTVTPLQDTDTVQRNLVSRDGEVERELERMRVLLARVTGRVAQLPDANDADKVNLGQLVDAEKNRIEGFLSDPKVFPT